MDKKIYEFWKDNALDNIMPAVGKEFPEGWNVVDYFKNLYTKEEYGDIVEIGCGYGRLCKAFNPISYLGLDISSSAINQARKTFPKYNFELIEESNLMKSYPHSRTKLLYTVLLHQSDRDLPHIIEDLCNTTRRIIVAEICGRDWRRGGNPPVFNREPQEYIALFNQFDRNTVSIQKMPYERYKNANKNDTNLSIMVFEN